MSDILTAETNGTGAVLTADRASSSRSASRLARGIGLVLAPRGDRRGITTVEYVIGIIAGITLVGVLILALTNDSVQDAIVALVTHIFGKGNSVQVGHASGKHT